MSEKAPKTTRPQGERVAAAVNYLGSKGPGFATLIEIWNRGAKMAKPTIFVAPGELLSLSFRFFETSNPVKVQVLVDEEGHSEKEFSVSFQNPDPIFRRTLIGILQQLRQRDPGEPCHSALLANR